MIQIHSEPKLSVLKSNKNSVKSAKYKMVQEMQKAVVIYSTTDGQTKRICEF